VIEPGEFLNEDGLPGLFLFSPAYNRVKDETGDDAEEREIIESIKSLWTGEEKFLLTRNPNGTPYKQEFTDVRDIVQGLVLGIEKDEALGEEFTLGGAALFRWEEAVPYLSERYNLDYVNARVLSSNHFEFDLTKIKTLLGYQPQHDLESVLDTAEAIRRGEDVGIIPTGIRWGKE
jgi:UDP-glucose 4-epimerase